MRDSERGSGEDSMKGGQGRPLFSDRQLKDLVYEPAKTYACKWCEDTHIELTYLGESRPEARSACQHCMEFCRVCNDYKLKGGHVCTPAVTRIEDMTPLQLGLWQEFKAARNRRDFQESDRVRFRLDRAGVNVAEVLKGILGGVK